MAYLSAYFNLFTQIMVSDMLKTLLGSSNKYWFSKTQEEFKFVWVSSLVGRYFYNVYIVKSLKLCFPLMSRTIIYVHVYIILDFLITYRNALVLCQSEFTCLHQTVNMVVFFFK